MRCATHRAGQGSWPCQRVRRARAGIYLDAGGLVAAVVAWSSPGFARRSFEFHQTAGDAHVIDSIFLTTRFDFSTFRTSDFLLK